MYLLLVLATAPANRIHRIHIMIQLLASSTSADACVQIPNTALFRTQTAMGPMHKEGAYTAVVSGASGYIGTELVKQLLEKGYNVRGTVRSTSNTDKIQHLTKLAEVRHELQAGLARCGVRWDAW